MTDNTKNIITFLVIVIGIVVFLSLIVLRITSGEKARIKTQAETNATITECVERGNSLEWCLQKFN